MNWKNTTELEVIEILASYEGLIASEEELSEGFDNLLLCDMEKRETLANDEVMLNEEFSYYADNLRANGLLHLLQYESYDYIGDLA